MPTSASITVLRTLSFLLTSALWSCYTHTEKAHIPYVSMTVHKCNTDTISTHGKEQSPAGTQKSSWYPFQCSPFSPSPITSKVSPYSAFQLLRCCFWTCLGPLVSRSPVPKGKMQSQPIALFVIRVFSSQPPEHLNPGIQGICPVAPHVSAETSVLKRAHGHCGFTLIPPLSLQRLWPACRGAVRSVLQA